MKIIKVIYNILMRTIQSRAAIFTYIEIRQIKINIIIMKKKKLKKLRLKIVKKQIKKNKEEKKQLMQII